MTQPAISALAILLLAAMSIASPAHAAAPDPAAAAASCKYVNLATLPLHYTGPALEITTTGTINHTPAVMLVDTGAWQTVLTSTGVERHQLKLSSTGERAYGIGGIARVYRTWIKELSTGGTQANEGYMPVLTDFGYVPSYDAIVGAPFLLQTDVEISLATKEMKFFRPLGCDQEFLAYWDADAVVVPLNPPRRGQANPRFNVSINGQNMVAIIDTGAATTSVTLRAAKRAGLKLDDPGLTRTSSNVGLGTRKPDSWRTVFERFEIGAETVNNAEVAVIDYDGDIDVLLGADFLRAHRVLLAPSQQRLYVSYLGGEPFGQRRTLEPWILAEASAGNPDAQMALANIYLRGMIVPKDVAQGERWLEQAASAGNPQAQLMSGRQMMRRGNLAVAVSRLRSGLDQLPSSWNGALWLYIARLRSGQAELATSELSATLARRDDDEWPAPLASFYLGKITSQQLLKQAADERASAHARTCLSLATMGEWHAARGERAQVHALGEQAKARCGPAPAP